MEVEELKKALKQTDNGKRIAMFVASLKLKETLIVVKNKEIAQLDTKVKFEHDERSKLEH
jgi:hypothetical protein